MSWIPAENGFNGLHPYTDVRWAGGLADGLSPDLSDGVAERLLVGRRIGAAGSISMTPAASLVSIVDDDESVREALPDLIKIFGFDVRAFSSATEFLTSKSVGETGCLVLDVAMPGMSGPDLQEELLRTGIVIPIIFITAHKDENERLALIKSGAVACLFKPFSATALRETLDLVFKRGK